MTVLAAFVGILHITGALGSFDSYWNVKEFCETKYDVDLDLNGYNIINNGGDNFNGDQVNILYKPGSFPRIEGQYTINGGIPENGSLALHYASFMGNLTATVSNACQGPLVLDFEVYRPSFPAAPQEYRDLSKEKVQNANPLFTTDQVKAKAEMDFNAASLTYFNSLLQLGKSARPNALIGYYHYPYCNNFDAPFEECTPQMQLLNDKLSTSMYALSSALYPSLYTKKNAPHSSKGIKYFAAKLKETNRVNSANVPVIPYISPVYRDTITFVPWNKMLSILWACRYYGAKGVVIWASYADFRSTDTCQGLKNYLDTVFGPLSTCMNNIPQAVVDVLRYRYPIFEGEDSTVQNLSPDAEQIVDDLVASFGSDASNWGSQKIVRKVLTSYCQQ